MKTTFEESGMTFEFDSDSIYRIEKSPIVMRLQSFKPCECVVRSGKYLDMIEAKTNAPNPNVKENQQNIDLFYKEIEQKFIDTLMFTTGITAKRHSDDTCPPSISSVTLSSIKYRFYIILKNVETKYLPEQQSIFKKKLKHVAKAWDIDDYCIKVLNEEEARNQGLIK